MKKLYLLLLAMFIGFGGFAQTILFQDDMESYNVGDYLAESNPTWYDTWGGHPGTSEDAVISDVYSHSPTKSARVDETGGATDLILLLGDKTSGQFELTWWMYLESNFAGYYNLQHFESPGIEWAMECYLNTDGTIDLLVGGSTINGTYPKDTWFEVKHEIDLDADNIKLYINGTLFYEWPFHYQGGGTTGTNQLGGVDFYAGAQGSDNPKYYFDDVYYAQTGGGGDPEITITPDALVNWVVAGGTTTDELTVQNTGESDLNWNLNIIYDIDSPDAPSITPGPAPTYYIKGPVVNVTAVQNPYPGGGPEPDASAVLHYDGDPNGGVYWTPPPVTPTVAARFPCSMTLPYTGMELISVDVYINGENAGGGNEKTLKIYGMGNSYEPGDLLYEAAFNAPAGDWTTVVLTTPVTITGEDLWVGYQFTQNETGVAIPGVDDGSNYNPNGDYVSQGVGWTHTSLALNWNIRANLEGTPISQWLSATPTSGTLPPIASELIDVGYDATNLDPGIYSAFIRFLSNDPVTPALDVPVELTVAGVGIDERTTTSVMIYPNPATNFITIKSDRTISSVQITDFSGKVLYRGTETNLDIRNLSSGIYFVRTVTDKGTSNAKFVKK
ncbi:MAG: T9SS C-terminal target domain-containing protein [Bacteroidetes bacterium]|nr:MAG: T9SS C-terminal target domain-containing protein [Bacteroidota bacterium]